MPKDTTLGFGPLDREHAILLGILARAETAARENNEVALGLILMEFHACLEARFEKEEGLMRAGGYPEVNAHVKQHRRLHEHLAVLNSLRQRGAPGPGESGVRLLQQWVTAHARGSDGPAVAYLRIHELPLTEVK